MTSQKKENLKKGVTVLKYLYPILLATMSINVTHTTKYLLMISVEVFVVFAIVRLIAIKNIRISRTINIFILFFIYAQSIVLFFTGSYIKLIMLTNLNSVEALKGKTYLYGFIVLLSLIILFLPFETLQAKKDNKMLVAEMILSGVLAVMATQLIGPDFSALYNTLKTANIMVERVTIEKFIRQKSGDENAFYSESIGNGIDRPTNLIERPNIILIFTEGMSKNIINDSRIIMPNVKAFEAEGISFDNYYNHTAATYRGIIGQLYSSHQYNNGDTNNLVSLQSVLKEKGYKTVLVNPEPNNKEFTEYLNSFGYDELTSNEVTDRSLTDEETYNTIFKSLVNNKSEKPLLITAYTFGTHVSFNSEQNQFGDGKNSLLNKFHYCDYQFGKMMERIKKEGYGNNTVVVFTTDHATYVDDDYIKSFYNEYKRIDAFCDTIPFIIWHEGIIPASIDACGRNSLDLTPTIMDYLDIDAPNYFLGSSLFQKAHNPEMETIFCVPDSGWCVNTCDGVLRDLNNADKEEYMNLIQNYLSLTMKTDAPIP